MVVQNKPQCLGGGIGGIKFGQELNEVTAFVRIVHNLGDPSGVQIQSSQQRHGTEALVFVVPEMTGMGSEHRRSVRSRHTQSLNSRLLS